MPQINKYVPDPFFQLRRTTADGTPTAFRSPHHTISDAGLVGGGSPPTPGEISKSHNGILFLDELPEFNRKTLEVMRQPMEDGIVTISRALRSSTFPANFNVVRRRQPVPLRLPQRSQAQLPLHAATGRTVYVENFRPADGPDRYPHRSPRSAV